MLDGLGHRYHLLPSQVLNQANTFDLYVMEKALTYRNNKINPEPAKAAQPTQEQLMVLLNKAKSKNK